MKKDNSSFRTSPAIAEWERQWQQRWSKVGAPACELPVGGPGGYERDFLTHARLPAVKARLKAV